MTPVEHEIDGTPPATHVTIRTRVRRSRATNGRWLLLQGRGRRAGQTHTVRALTGHQIRLAGQKRSGEPP